LNAQQKGSLWPEGMAGFTIVGQEANFGPALAQDLIFATTDGYITAGAVSNHEQVVSNGTITTLEQPALGQVRQPRPAARFSSTPAEIRVSAPALGQHSRDILTELGLDQSEIEVLFDRNVVA
jgi:crotonobetainyl-CoA:carnitine CoA-transferase CaiB-like acyl-CoA transferase